jgi:hypothetical protein
MKFSKFRAVQRGTRRVFTSGENCDMVWVWIFIPAMIVLHAQVQNTNGCPLDYGFSFTVTLCTWSSYFWI